MGRHRRSGAETPAEGAASHVQGMGTPLSEAYADANARSAEYLYGTGADGGTDADGPRRRRQSGRRKSVRAGLLGVSVAVALGAVAVTSGVVPGLESYRLGGGSSSDASGGRAQVSDSPTNAASEQGGAVPGASVPSASPSPEKEKRAAEKKVAEAKPSASPSEAPVEEASAPAPAPAKKSAAPEAPAARQPDSSKASAAVSSELQAAAQVLVLVNEERAKVGCSALSANSALAELARKFSEDMAARGFFDHTDPDGKSPWDRAAAAGISDLAGENIARGQGDPAAVMEAWMNSPGHKANILNCDFKTLGVGVHFGSGGPWWTQDFGY
ncbi:CAP domain-containing protein [Streptomyces sp. S6]